MNQQHRGHHYPMSSSATSTCLERFRGWTLHPCPFQCFTTLPMKNFSLISDLNLPQHNVRLFPLILSPGPWEKRPSSPLLTISSFQGIMRSNLREERATPTAQREFVAKREVRDYSKENSRLFPKELLFPCARRPELLKKGFSLPSASQNAHLVIQTSTLAHSKVILEFATAPSKNPPKMIFATIYSCWLPGNQGCLLINQMDSNSSSLSNLLGILGMGTSQYFTTTPSPLTKVPEGTGLGCFCTWSSVIPLGGICFQPFTPQIPENRSSGDSWCLQGSLRKIPSKYRF